MKPLTLSFLVLAGLFVLTPAFADTDYRCLTLCVNSGSPAATCMPQCTYNNKTVATPTQQQSGQAGSPNNVLETPTPLGGKLLIPPDQSRVNAIQSEGNSQAKDYTCLTKCQQNGLKSQMCDQICAPPSQGVGGGAPKPSAMSQMFGTPK